MLGATSGIRAEELYQLNIEDIDIRNKILHIKSMIPLILTLKSFTALSVFYVKYYTIPSSVLEKIREMKLEGKPTEDIEKEVSKKNKIIFSHSSLDGMKKPSSNN